MSEKARINWDLAHRMWGPNLDQVSASKWLLGTPSEEGWYDCLLDGGCVRRGWWSVSDSTWPLLWVIETPPGTGCPGMSAYPAKNIVQHCPCPLPNAPTVSDKEP